MVMVYFKVLVKFCRLIVVLVYIIYIYFVIRGMFGIVVC